jgi:hypothetical protein
MAIGLAGGVLALLSMPVSAVEKNASATKQLKVPKEAKSGAHNSAGEDSRGLFQINVAPQNRKLRPGQTLEVRVTKPRTGTARSKLKKP